MAEVEYSFQTDSKFIKDCLLKENFKIFENPDSTERICAVYFSSNDLYYPNDEKTFYDAVILKDRFEWERNQIGNVKKHVFLRDIKKQWYLEGISNEINSIEKLANWLIMQTNGYKVYMVGSSAGGYAAMLFGSLLKVARVYAFNAQFDLWDILNNSNKNLNPVLARNQDNFLVNKYYRLDDVLEESNSELFYFQSSKCQWDVNQYNLFNSKHLVKTIKSRTGKHGFPFLKINIPYLFQMNKEELVNMSNKSHHPFFFSIKAVGLYSTISFLVKEVYRYGLLKLRRDLLKKYKIL